MFFEAATELIGFIASFFATGAAAFRYVVLRDDAAAELEVERLAARRAAGVVVLVVIALGAWNWRRQRPLLGSESAAAVLQRSASYEVAAATVVLVITSVLVSLPSPR